MFLSLPYNGNDKNWKKLQATKESYYVGDAASIDSEGYIWFAGRSDEVIKISAHRIGTIEIKSTLIAHPAVVEAGVSGVPDELRGEVVSAFVVLKPGYEASADLSKELIAHIRKTMGAILVMRDIIFVRALPKTRSGKIMRRIMKALLTGQDIGDTSTIEDETSIKELREVVTRYFNEIFRLMGIARDDVKQRRDWEARGYRFFNAPAVIYIMTDDLIKNTKYAYFDIGAVCQTICLSAMKYGLGTCIEAQAVYFPEIANKYLCLPENKELVIGIAIGYPDFNFPANKLRSQREPVENITSWYGLE